MERYKELVIFGCGGHSRSVVDIILANDPLASLVFVDQNARENETIYGFPVIKGIDVSERQVFIAIGDNASRKEKFYELGEVNSISVISAKALPRRDMTNGSGAAGWLQSGQTLRTRRWAMMPSRAVATT